MHLKEGRYWVYTTYDSWCEQFPFWSKSTVVRTFNKLEKEGLIESKNYNKMKIDQTKWYTINYEKLDELSSVQLKKNRPSIQIDNL